ncbi:MAG: hypothetical protein H6832_11850 [Planctomycetes bacterium]|nr:hypothetical protein [Planctomycetota bacterium]MCB9919086.1 hypothetical protein [Planctomycetota bacterium]
MRSFPSLTSLFLISASAALAAPADAQSYQIERSGGAIGQTLSVDLSGPNGSGFLLLPSLSAGPIPLAVLDPTDTRVLEVGLDLPDFLTTGVFGASKITLQYPIPNDTNLVGLVLHYHGFLFPGTTRLAGELCNPVRANLGRSDAFTSRGAVLTNATAIPTTDALADGRVLLAGGGSGNLLSARGLDTTEFYDADRQTFSPGPKLAAPRALHQSVTLANGKVLLIGGANAQGLALATCEVFDPATDKFSAAASMATGRAGHTATLLGDGRVLVTGGSTTLTDAASAIFGTQSSCEIYDPTTNSWSSARGMSRVRLGHAAIRLANGKVLVCGGATVTFILPGTTNTAELFDPTTGTWSGTGSMTHAVAAQVLQPLADGRIVAVGGAVLSGLTNVTSTDLTTVYDPSKGSWVAGGKLGGSRALPAVVRLANGKVLACGGAQGSITTPTALASCELLDPTTLQWSTAPSMTTARAGAVGLLRPEGMLYVVGGAGGSQNAALATGEITYPR